MNIASYIDHTVLKPDASKEDIIKLCDEAKLYGFASVCINPYRVSLAKSLLSCTNVKICTVIGFPLGAAGTESKVNEAKKAYDDGCDEFDMVINIGALKDKDYEYVKNDILQIVNAVNGKTVKVIIETYFLDDEEKKIACSLASEAGAHFVKTCTGFCPGKATIEDVRLMKSSVKNGVKVKASAGIRTYKDAKSLIEAGADRIGTSAGTVIIKEASEN